MQTQPITLAPTQFQALALSELDFPEPLLATLFAEPDPQLLQQVKQHGLFAPLPVHRITAHCSQLLAGFQYLPVLRKLGAAEVTCQLIAEPATFSSYALRIEHGMSTVAQSPILQALLLRQAVSQLQETEVLALLPLLGIKAQRYKLDELLGLLSLEPEVIAALHAGILAAKNSKLFPRIDAQDQKHLISLLEMFHPGGSKQQRLIEMLMELRLRMAQPMETLTAPWMISHLDNEQKNLPQQLQSLLRFLQEQTTPHLLEAEKTFQQNIQDLELPPHVQLHHSLSFEDESVELRVTYKDLADFKRSWPGLASQLHP